MAPSGWTTRDTYPFDKKKLEFRCMVHFFRHMDLTDEHCQQTLGTRLINDPDALRWVRIQKWRWLDDWRDNLWGNENFYEFIRTTVEHYNRSETGLTTSYTDMTDQFKIMFWNNHLSQADVQRWLQDFNAILRTEEIVDSNIWCLYTRAMFVAAAKATWEYYISRANPPDRPPTRHEKVTISQCVEAESRNFMPTPPPAWEVPLAVVDLW